MSSAPAGVTPLASQQPSRHRVSFTPAASAADNKKEALAAPPAALDADEVRRQYGAYRSAPGLFPSYERLRFVRLPGGMVPPALLTTCANSANGGPSESGEGDGRGDGPRRPPSLLRHWPALVYGTLAELVRDLPPSSSSILKGQLFVEHRRSPNTVVARLVGWDPAVPRASGSDHFPESRTQILRLSSPTVGGCESDGDLLQFYERQIDVEAACADALSGGGADEDVAGHAARLMSALDVALNVLALDVGSDPLPPRVPAPLPTGGGESKDGKSEANPPSDGAAASSGGPAREAVTTVPPARAGGILRTPGTSQGDAAATSSGVDSGAKTPSTALRSALRTPATDDAVAGPGERERGGGGTKRVSIGGVPTRPDDGEDVENDVDASNAGADRGGSEEPAADVETNEERDEEDESAARVQVEKLATRPAAAAKRQAKSRPASRKAARGADRDEDAAPHKPPSAPPSPLMSWKEAWSAMRSSGWTWKAGSGLMTDYYYIRPGRKVSTGTAGLDYFTSESDVVDYASRAFGFGTGSGSEVRARIEEHARHSGETVPPLLGGNDVGPDEPWRSVWDRMLRSGWKWKQGSGLMMDYYYVKPGRSVKGGADGEDYFRGVEEVQDFARRNYGWLTRGGIASGGGDGREEKDGVLPPRRARSTRYSRHGTAAGNADEAEQEEFQSDPEPEEDEEEPEEQDEPDEEEEEESEEDEDTAVLDSDEDEMHDRRHPDDEEEFEDMDFHGTDEEEVDDDDEEDPEPESEEDPEPEEESDDDESRFSDRSTYSRTGFEDKRLFPDDAADGGDDDVPALAVPLDVREPWSSAWRKMRSSGWTWKIGTGLMTDYFYLKPGRDSRTGTEGKDYFTSERDVRRFAVRNYGWRGPDGVVPGIGSTLKKRRRNRKDSYANRIVEKVNSVNKRQRSEDAVPAKPAAGEGETVAAAAGDPAEPPGPSPRSGGGDSYSFRCLWPRLLAAGWSYCKAGRVNPLHDWYYCRPGANPAKAASVLGIHYFLSEEDVVAFVRRRDEADKLASDGMGPADVDAEARPIEEKGGGGRAAASGSSEDVARSGDGDAESDPLTPSDSGTRPRDPAKPPASSPPGSSASGGSDSYSFKSLWPRLHTAGWRHRKAGRVNPLHDWYYCRPGVIPAEAGSVLGTHYFLSEDEVVAFVRRCDEADAKLTSAGTGLLV